MDLSKNISEILQQYEFAMAIGNHLEFNKNCDQFLKLVLARKNLSNCWILKQNAEDETQYNLRYAYPNYSEQKTIPKNETLVSCFATDKMTFHITPTTDSILPVALNKGAVLFFNLKQHGGLFLHGAEKQAFSSIEIAQLSPIIDKFIVSLTACKSYSKQELLLKKLENQNKELQDYAQAVSHDLKSPLRNICTLISWTKEDASKLDEATNANLDLINKNIEKMDALISGILEYSLVDKKKTLSTQINTQEIVRDVIHVLHTPPSITFIISETLPVVHADKHRIQQLFHNLISNAVSSMDKEKGVIHITAKEEKQHWQFAVEDNGKGIEDKYHQKIFEIFQRIDNATESTGIGLSIVQKIVNFYGGSVWLTSEKGKGTIFYFTLKK